MISIRHCGIYVGDIERLTNFYINVFNMHVVCQQELDKGFFVEKLSGESNAYILVTKLITDKGKMTGSGDMIELIKFVSASSYTSVKENKKFTDIGVTHIALECDDLFDISQKVILNGGEIIVPPFTRENGNELCFCKDPEGNCLELIVRKVYRDEL